MYFLQPSTNITWARFLFCSGWNWDLGGELSQFVLIVSIELGNFGSYDSAMIWLPNNQTAKISSDNGAKQRRTKAERQSTTPFARTYFHGTKADLKVGDLIVVGFNSNFGQRKNAKYIFLTGTLDAAICGAELAFGDGPERVYLVEPTGEVENDPDLTDQKFPGNPTQSFRSTHPFRVVGEVTAWQGHSADQVRAMKEHLEKLKEQGIDSLND